MLAVLTHNSSLALAELGDRVESYSRAAQVGQLVTGDTFRILILERPEDAHRYRGVEFHDTEIVGSPNRDAVQQLMPWVRSA